MKSLLPFLLVYIAVCGSVANAQLLSYNTSHTYLEQALRRFVEYYRLDPMTLPNVNQSFERRVFFTRFRGQATLTNGSLVGLSTVHRTEYFHFSATRKGIYVHADFGAGPLQLLYAGDVTLIGMTYAVDVVIAIQKIRVILEVVEELGKGLMVKNFRIKTMEGLTLQLKNRGTFSYMFNLFAKGTTYFFENLIRDRVDNTLRYEFNQAAKQLNDFVLRNPTIREQSNKTLAE
uniref:Putative secreted protein n=2 Tax=Ixodes ricinus TaxID=34613 RepID=V5H9A4_IXORI